MAKITSNQFFKNKSLLLFCFVLFGLFICENIFASQFPIENYVVITWDDQKNQISINVKFYVFSYGVLLGHGFLKWCHFEASEDGKNYFNLMDIYTPLQMLTDKSMLHFANKLQNARIRFHNSINPPAGTICPYDKTFTIQVFNAPKHAFVSVGWLVGSDFLNVRYFRLSGIWQSIPPCPTESFNNVIYQIKGKNQSMLKSNSPGISTKVSRNDIVKVCKDSEAIVIKGANHGVNIKVYTMSGAEIKSVVSDNDLVKIKLPVNQPYIVHVGNARYKVAA